MRMSNPAQRQSRQSQRCNRRLFILLLGALFLLSSLVGLVGCDSRDEQSDQLELGQQQQLEALSARLGTLENRFQQQQGTLQGQSSVLQKILVNVSPVGMAPEWEQRLAQLEDQVSDDSQWPKDAGEAEHFLEQASELVTGLPVRAEPQYLPRLSPIRWAAMAFAGMYDPLNDAPEPEPSLERLDQLADELRALADARPEGGPEKLAAELRKRAAKLAGKAARHRVTEAVAQAKQYLDDGPGAVEDVARLHELLELYAADDERGRVDVDILTLRNDLYKNMLQRQADEQATTLQGRWENAQKLAHDEPALHEASARTLLQQVVSARVALVLEGVAASDHAGLVTLENELRGAVRMIEIEAAQRAEERRAKALRSYQEWALSEILKFEDALKGISAKEYQEVGEALKKHILPVSRALLDLPIHERYRQAFQEGWRKLDGHDEQTEVAKASALAKKKSLREYLEGRP